MPRNGAVYAGDGTSRIRAPELIRIVAGGHPARKSAKEGQIKAGRFDTLGMIGPDKLKNVIGRRHILITGRDTGRIILHIKSGRYSACSQSGTGLQTSQTKTR
jgi:hypothetical protein